MASDGDNQPFPGNFVDVRGTAVILYTSISTPASAPITSQKNAVNEREIKKKVIYRMQATVPNKYNKFGLDVVDVLRPLDPLLDVELAAR